MNTLKRIVNVKGWKKKTKIVTIVVIIAIIVASILSAVKPSRLEMISQASPEMQKMIEKDETLTRKRVSSAYNDLIIINYSAFSTSGATELSEKFVGFAGKIYKADKGTAGIVGKMVETILALDWEGQNNPSFGSADASWCKAYYFTYNIHCNSWCYFRCFPCIRKDFKEQSN